MSNIERHFLNYKRDCAAQCNAMYYALHLLYHSIAFLSLLRICYTK